MKKITLTILIVLLSGNLFAANAGFDSTKESYKFSTTHENLNFLIVYSVLFGAGGAATISVDKKIIPGSSLLLAGSLLSYKAMQRDLRQEGYFKKIRAFKSALTASTALGSISQNKDLIEVLKSFDKPNLNIIEKAGALKKAFTELEELAVTSVAEIQAQDKDDALTGINDHLNSSEVRQVIIDLLDGDLTTSNIDLMYSIYKFEFAMAFNKRFSKK